MDITDEDPKHVDDGNGVRAERFDVILADPPWSYDDKAHAGRRGVEYHYPSMPIVDLKAIPVADLAQINSVMYLWVTPPMLQVGLDLIKTWGFTFKTIAFVWIKKSPNGKLAWGMGSYTRANAEIVLLGIRGKGIPVVDHGVHQIVEAPRQEHSRKPDEVLERIEKLHGNAKRIELFARRRRPGWSAWGNQVDADIDLADGKWKRTKPCEVIEPIPDTDAAASKSAVEVDRIQKLLEGAYW